MPLSYHTVFASGCSSIDCDDAQGQQIGENQFLKFSADCRDGGATVCRFGDFAARFTLHDARATGCNASLHASHEVERFPRQVNRKGIAKGRGPWIKSYTARCGGCRRRKPSAFSTVDFVGKGL